MASQVRVLPPPPTISTAKPVSNDPDFCPGGQGADFVQSSKDLRILEKLRTRGRRIEDIYTALKIPTPQVRATLAACLVRRPWPKPSPQRCPATRSSRTLSMNSSTTSI